MAVSLVCVDEAPLVHQVERLLGRPIPVETIPGFEPNRDIRPEPIRLRTGQGGGRPMGRSRPGGAPRHHTNPAPARSHASVGRWPVASGTPSGGGPRRDTRRSYGRARP